MASLRVEVTLEASQAANRFPYSSVLAPHGWVAMVARDGSFAQKSMAAKVLDMGKGSGGFAAESTVIC